MLGQSLCEHCSITSRRQRRCLKASPNELAEVEGIGVALARRIRSTEGIELAEEVIVQCEDASIDILLPHDRRFPSALLRELPDPPERALCAWAI